MEIPVSDAPPEVARSSGAGFERASPALVCDEELWDDADEAAERAAVEAVEARRLDALVVPGSFEGVDARPVLRTPPEARRARADPDPAADLPALVEPYGYFRDRAGRWRYRHGSDLVPGARDVTLARLWRFERRDGMVLVPRRLLAEPSPAPELAWCVRLGTPQWAASPGAPRRRRPFVEAMAVLEAHWRERAPLPLGLDAPELVVDRLLDTAAVARLAAVDPATVRSYVARGYLPGPVRRLAGVPLWSLPVLLRALAARPGQGVRSNRTALSVSSSPGSRGRSG